MTQSNLGMRSARVAGNPNILAVVIAHNPHADLVSNLRALRAEIETVWIIDNRSENGDIVRNAAREAECHLIVNPGNIGIGAALNQAVRLAIDAGADWIAMFDQDSCIEHGSIRDLLSIYQTHPNQARIATISMSHRDRGTGRDYHLLGDVIEEGRTWRSVRSTITSGTLARVAIFDDVGLFDSRLFIDSVDEEFCLRCRQSGFLIIESKLRVLDHALGESIDRRFLGIRFTSTNHSADRRYYITRNKLHVCFENISFDPFWAIRGTIHLIVSNILVLIYESDKRAKLKAILGGMRDFFLHRFGQRPR